MKKIWNQYSYAIILILLSFGISFIFSAQTNKSTNDEYLSIEVAEGDSLWHLSQKYREDHNLSQQQFIKWVKKTNGIEDTIYAGDTLVIPVMKENSYITEVASLVEN